MLLVDEEESTALGGSVTLRARHILACASQGAGSSDEARLRTLLSSFPSEFLSFDRGHRLGSFLDCFRRLVSPDVDLFVLEGTGVGAGFAAILARALFGKRFVFSSGDAVGPFLAARHPLISPVFHLYERLLYRMCDGFVGWTPYLVGRALTLGAQHAITCAGWAPFPHFTPREGLREGIRQGLGIPCDAVVFGIAGSLHWSSRYRYCYGMELVRALRRCHSEIYVLIVGDGSGLSYLKEEAGRDLGGRILFTGHVARELIPAYLSAMDVGSLPQSVDQVGGFRYSTKLAEYKGIGLPFVTNHIPAAYDLDEGDLWRLPGRSPWSETFVDALSRFMSRVAAGEICTRKKVGLTSDVFNRDRQVAHMTAFIEALLLDGA